MLIKEDTLRIEQVSLRNYKISFHTDDTDALNYIGGLDTQKPLEVNFKRHRPKRSVDANALFWKLADEVAIVLNSTKEEVYRNIVYDVGVFDDIAIVEAGCDKFVSNWNSKGIGWIAEVQPDCKINGCKKIRCYYGSSTYNTKQMSRLIDRVIDEAKSLGIETATPDEIERLKQQWQVKFGER